MKWTAVQPPDRRFEVVGRDRDVEAFVGLVPGPAEVVEQAQVGLEAVAQHSRLRPAAGVQLDVDVADR